MKIEKSFLVKQKNLYLNLNKKQPFLLNHEIQYGFQINTQYNDYYQNTMHTSRQTIIRQIQITQFLKKPQHHQKLIKILIQTLTNLGYKQSAHSLQKQSNVKYFDQDLQMLQQKLAQSSLHIQQINVLFQRLLDGLDVETQNDVRISVLQIEIGDLYRQINHENHNIKNGQVEGLQKIQKQIIKKIQQFSKMVKDTANQQLKSKIYSIISNFIFGDRGQWLKKRRILVQRIIQKCEKTGIQKFSMQRIIKFYIQKKFFQNNTLIPFTDLSEFSLFSNQQLLITPPQNQFYISKQQTSYDITFIKINQRENLILTVGFNRSYGLESCQSQMCIWNLQIMCKNYQKKNLIESSQKINRLKVKGIINWVCWNFARQDSQQLISVAFRQHKMAIYDSKLDLKAQTNLQTKVILCCQFNPFTGFIYGAGLLQSVRVWDQNLEELQQFKCIKIRQFMFSGDGLHAYALSAVQNKIISVNASDFSENNSIKFEQRILTINLAQQKNLILITTLQKIYLIDISNFQIKKKITLGQYKLEKPLQNSTKYISPAWIINFNNKVCYAWNLNDINQNAHKCKQVEIKQQYSAFQVVQFHQFVKIISAQKKRLHLWKFGREQNNNVQEMKSQQDDLNEQMIQSNSEQWGVESQQNQQQQEMNSQVSQID